MITFYFTEVYRSILQSKLASFITIVSLSIAVLASVVSISLVMLSGKIDEELKERVEVDIFLAQEASSKELSDFENRLNTDSRIQSVTFFSKEEARENFIEETGEDFVSILEANPLPASFRVKFKSEQVSTSTIDAFALEIEKQKIVDEVVYDYSTIISLINFINSSRYAVFIISAVFVVLAIYLVYSTNKLQMQHKYDIYNTMKLVGATLKTLKIPIYITGIIFGIISSILSVFVIYVVAELIQKFYYNLNFVNYIYITTFVIVLLGLFFGLMGSYISSRNLSLKVKKLK